MATGSSVGTKRQEISLEEDELQVNLKRKRSNDDFDDSIPGFQLALDKKMLERRKSARRIYPEEGGDHPPENDDELLCLDLPDWFEMDGVRHIGFIKRQKKRNKPEVYFIYLDTSICEESDCRRVLQEIGCADRFLACSIEVPFRFFAKLTRQEAQKLEGINGVSDVRALKDTVIYRDC